MNRPATPPTVTSRWAPWWLYLIILLPANYLRDHLMSGHDVPPVVSVIAAVGQAFLLFVVITALWRASRPGADHRQQW